MFMLFILRGKGEGRNGIKIPARLSMNMIFSPNVLLEPRRRIKACMIRFSKPGSSVSFSL